MHEEQALRGELRRDGRLTIGIGRKMIKQRRPL
jgi:hypothetical protein